MKICIFISTLLPGGAEKQSLLLQKALEGVYETHLVVFNGNMLDKNYLDYIGEQNRKVICLKGNTLKRMISFMKFLRKNKKNLIFSYLPKDNLFCAIAGKIAGVKYIIGGIRTSVIPYHKLIVLRLLHNYITDFTVFNNYLGLEEMHKRGFKRNKSITIPNTFVLNRTLIKRVNSNPVNIISVGRFIEVKDYITAIKAIHYFMNNYVEIGEKVLYTIIGYGKLEKQIRSWINRYDLSESIQVAINPQNISKYYRNADIFLLTSLYEGMSNSIMEAMSYSLPIVATDVGDNAYLVKNNINGYLRGVKNYKKIAEALFELVISHEKRINFGKQSYYILRKNCSFEIFQNSYMELIENLRSLEMCRLRRFM